jgi:YVTN family beta-propeller protein
MNRRPWLVVVLAMLLAVAVGASEAIPSPSGPAAEPAAKKKQKKKKGKKKRKGKKKPPAQAPAASDLREVILVGNNWEGTADVIEVRYPASAAAEQKGKKKGKKGRRKKARGKGRAKRSAEAAAKCKTKRGKKRAKGKKGKRLKRKGRRKAKRRECAKPQERPRPTYHRVTRVNIVPDLQQRLNEIVLNPVDLAYFLAINVLIGEGHNQYVDDMYTTNDGRLLVVSRPSLKDVVGINLKTGKLAWRFEVSGQRADHMGISPDGKRVAVSASTGNRVHILDTETGRQVGVFPSGDSPHENTYSEDGQRLYHASIGLVYTPLDRPLLDSSKGDRRFQVVDTATNRIIKRIDIGNKLAAAGYPNMSSAVRPMAITSDESRVYMQVSFFHGFVEYDNVNDQVLRLARLPDLTGGLPREAYLLDSAHHGIALDGEDRTLCVAGTMSDYAALVDRENFGDYTMIKQGTKPYWSTTSEDGRFCYVSWSGTDAISVIDYETRKVVAHIPVGDHPQRVRSGVVPQSFIDAHR